jgi:hypothetical protein
MDLTVERPCPSCGALGPGPFCSACGRKRVTQLPTVGEMVVEAKDELLGIERRALTTLWSALIRPGEIADAWRHGNGSRFTSPLKLYLTASGLYLAIAQVTGNVTTMSVSGRTANARLDIAVALSLPILALALCGLYGIMGGLRPRLSEAISFSLSFLSAVFAIGLAAMWLPNSMAIPLAFLAYSGWYFWRGAVRLWEERGLFAPIRALFVAGMYGLIVMLAMFAVYELGIA